MPFDPSGQPTLPTCESDVSRWATQFTQWVISKLTAAHSEIDDIVIDPVDPCTLVQSLHPGCQVPANGIDLANLSYAELGQTLPLPAGVLPYPNTVGIRSGEITATYPGLPRPHVNVTVTIDPPFPDGEYFVTLTHAAATSANVEYSVEPNSRTGSQFVFDLFVREGCDGGCTVKFYWIAHHP